MSISKSMLDLANDAAFGKSAKARRSRYALAYHIAAPSGWLNDPNGLVRFGGRYHVFYQHHPFSAQWGPMYWGHASSADLAHWRHEPVALAPDQPYEKGCFSGSAVDDQGVLTLIYTAHDDDSPVKETQCIARSFDGGQTFVKSPLNPVIGAYPAECSSDFRDPKVWRQDGRWHMVVGSRHGGRGCALLYSGDDLEHWEYRGILCEGDGTLGDMWECPNYCRVDGQDLLIVSPMNMPGHKNIALFGAFDAAAGRMALDHWQELDLGDDFYAAQIMEDEGRMLLIGWMDMWGRAHPTEEDGWAGALTLPRELHVRNGRLIQLPAPELKALRGEKAVDSDAGERAASGRCLEIRVGGMDGCLVLADADGMMMEIRLNQEGVSFTLAGGRTVAAPLSPEAPRELIVFIDRCSVECFAGGGEVCFTERLYAKELRIDTFLRGAGRMEAWTLNPAFEEASC